MALGQFYFVSATGAVPNGSVYSALGISAMVAMIAGMLIHRPRHVIAWAFAVVGLGLFLAGDYVYADLVATQAFVAFPSIADWIYLAMYPVFAVAIVLLGRTLAPHRTWSAVAFGLLTTLATVGVLQFIYMGDLIAEPFFDTKMRMVAVAYPLLDAVMFGFAAWLGVISRRGSVSLTLMALALVSLVVGNAIYNVQLIAGSFDPGGPADLFWIGFAALLGVACLHPSMTSTDRLTTTSAAVVESARHSVKPSESALAAVERRTLLDMSAVLEATRSSSGSTTRV
ncbi:MAG: hypothetical protein ACJAXA_000064 [Candidatus Aldehydirespiratoraceae bacterium]